jgi:hypothetical protein
VISAATYPLIAGYFICAELGEQPLRSLAPPLRVYRVLRPSGAQSRLEVVAARGLTPLVGREAEVGLLVERWARVKVGMGQVVVLTGEAGIGKARLVQVLKEHAASEAYTCLECRGAPYSQHTAWYPIADLVQRWLQWRPGEAPGAMLEQLETLLAPYHVALDEVVPLMADLAALPLPAGRYPAQSLPPEQQRQKTFETLLALVGALAERQPVLVIVEDLHWVDASTLKLLGLLLDQVPITRLYIVLTHRPEFQPPWGFRTYLTPLILNRLTPAQAEVMVGRMLGGQRLPAAVLEQIVAQTEGIPLFVEEVTKAVLEAGCSTDVQAQNALRGQGSAVVIPVSRRWRRYRSSQRVRTPGRRPSICALLSALRSTRWANSSGSSSAYRTPKPLLRTWATPTGWDGSRPICSPTLWWHATRTAPSWPASAPWQWLRPWGIWASR